MTEVYSGERLFSETRIDNLLNEGNLYGAIIIALNYSVSFETKMRLLEMCVEQNKIKILTNGINTKKPIPVKFLNIRTIEKFLAVCLEIKGSKEIPRFIVQKSKYYKTTKA